MPPVRSINNNKCVKYTANNTSNVNSSVNNVKRGQLACWMERGSKPPQESHQPTTQRPPPNKPKQPTKSQTQQPKHKQNQQTDHTNSCRQSATCKTISSENEVPNNKGLRNNNFSISVQGCLGQKMSCTTAPCAIKRDSNDRFKLITA